MGFKYKDVKKDIFVDRHKWLDIIEDHDRFLNKIKELKLYLVKFDENDKIKDKIYSSDYGIGDKNCQPVIVITHNECIFSTNDGICKVWTRIRDIFLCSKD